MTLTPRVASVHRGHVVLGAVGARVSSATTMRGMRWLLVLVLAIVALMVISMVLSALRWLLMTAALVILIALIVNLLLRGGSKVR